MMSPSRATLLFYIATHTLVARATSSVGSGDASATSGLGSDDAISSGDDDHGGSETTSSTLVPMCHAPSYSDVNRIQRNLTQEEREKLVIEGRCYLTCTTLTERFNQTKVRQA